MQWRPLKRSRRKRKDDGSASCLKMFLAKNRLHQGSYRLAGGIYMPCRTRTHCRTPD
jgi:hypothetical protein